MRKVLKTAATLLTALLISSASYGVDFYTGGRVIFVSPTRGDDNNPGTFREPLKHIESALKQAEPGDTVVLLKGTYKENVRTVRDGAPGKPITIVGMPGAVIKGNDRPRGREVEITNSYITLSNLKIDGHFKDCEQEDCYHDELIYVHGEPGNYLTGVKLIALQVENALGECIRFKYTQNSEVGYSQISNCGLSSFKFGKGTNGEGIYIGTAPEQTNGKPDRTSNIYIHNNSIRTEGSECIDVKEGATNVKISNNLCSGNLQSTVGGISIRGNSNLVEKNISFGNRGAGIRLGGDTKQDGICNTVVENALIDNEDYALKIMREPQSLICGNYSPSEKLKVKPENREIERNAFIPCRNQD